MTAPAPSQAWQARFPSRAHVERYLMTIKDPATREHVREKLGLEPISACLPPRPVRPMLPILPVRPIEPLSFEAEPSRGRVELSLPYPPSLNAIWRSMVVRYTPKNPNAIPYRARVLLSERGREYRRAVASAVIAAGSPRTPPGARLSVTLHVFAPDQRKRDLSNIPKALEDALTHAGVWADDSLIDEEFIKRGPVVAGGRVDVVITPLTSTLFAGTG
ncbi:RusA family crossover junction endodeoxyribonuclease [Deinococcus oregonensis]|uniref:RusA family crossover junction endodeoxyribonuclease n=1 Tax=Deinococcus oregonensis TaxID=1805970 RepID=A0ABV6B2W4_9DEIO